MLSWAVYEAGGYSWTTGGDEPALADVNDTDGDGSWSVGFDHDDVGAGDLTGLWPDAGAAGAHEVYGPLPFSSTTWPTSGSASTCRSPSCRPTSRV